MCLRFWKLRAGGANKKAGNGGADKILDYADRPSFCLYSSGLILFLNKFGNVEYVSINIFNIAKYLFNVFF